LPEPKLANTGRTNCPLLKLGTPEYVLKLLTLFGQIRGCVFGRKSIYCKNINNTGKERQIMSKKDTVEQLRQAIIREMISSADPDTYDVEALEQMTPEQLVALQKSLEETA